MAGKALYSRPVENIDNGLFEAYQRAVEHPRDMLDMLCVADLASWTAVRTPWFGPDNVPDWESGPSDWFGSVGAVLTGYMCHAPEWTGQTASFSPIGSALAFLWRQLAWEDQELRPLADYFSLVLADVRVGLMRQWPLDVYSDATGDRIKHESPMPAPRNADWNEWGSDL